MGFDLSLVGTETKPSKLAYDWRTLATYALGIGAKRDELPFLYEHHKDGMQAYPTFGVIPAHGPVVELLSKSGADMAMIVHGGQTVRCHRPLPSSGELQTVGTLSGIYDLKRFAQVILDTKTTIGDELVYETTWSIIVRGAGNFGGPRPPEKQESPPKPHDGAPDFRVEEKTSPEQALLYRVCADDNPLHADPEFAERVGFPQGPILHGLCTYGFAGRAVLNGAAGRDPSKVKRLSAQFRKPVWPGETLITEGYDTGDGRIALVTKVAERDEAVLGQAWAELSR